MRWVTLLYKTLWHIILYYLTPAHYSKGQDCSLDAPDVLGIQKNGDIKIGAVLPLHINKVYPQVKFTERPGQILCKIFPLEHYLQLHVIRYAIEEINNNPNILPNISLGFQIFDSCVVLQRELEGSLWMLTGEKKSIPNFQCQDVNRLAAIIGHSTSTHSILMAHILGLNRYPQVSYFATSSLLSDRTQFPSFFRTVPSDAFQSLGLAQVVLHFGWTWVGLLATDNEYGQQGIQVLRQELVKSGVCVEFTGYIQNNWSNSNKQRLVDIIKRSTAKVVVVYSTDLSFLTLLDDILKQNISQKIWIASEAWAKSGFLSASFYSRILAGTIGFAFYGGNIPGFHEFIKQVNLTEPPGEAWYNMFLEEFFGCELEDFRHTFAFPQRKQSRNCTASDTLDNFPILMNNVSNVAILSNLHSAVHAIAKALHDLSSCKTGRGPFMNRSCADIRTFQPWQLLHYMKKVNFRLVSGREIFFDVNGNPPPAYDIVNWHLGPDNAMKQIKVGSYGTVTSLDKVLYINTSMLRWANGAQKVPISVCSKSCLPGFRKASIRGKPICCFECICCPPGEISNSTDSFECFKCPWNEWPNNEKDSCLPKHIEFLSFQEPLGITLSSTGVTSSTIPMAILVLLMYYRTSPAVKANNFTLSCLLLISLSLCFLCSLAFIGYPYLEKCRLRQVTFGMVFALCVSCILAKTIMVVIAFKATKPNSSLRKWAKPKVSYLVMGLGILIQMLICTIWLVLCPPFPEYNSSSQSGVLVIECNEGSPIAFWGTLGYLGFLALISFLVAFLSRRLPGSFNEAKFITFSMLAFLSVWVSFIPASLSTRGKYTTAMEIFAIQSSSWAMLCCMFAPKCYIILLHPNMNSRQNLTGQTKKSKRQ